MLPTRIKRPEARVLAEGAALSTRDLREPSQHAARPRRGCVQQDEHAGTERRFCHLSYELPF